MAAIEYFGLMVRKLGAFTVIELLVVIAFIALLIATPMLRVGNVGS